MKQSRTTVLYTHGGGRFGNQMLRFLHWLAWVHEHPERRRVVNLAFWPYAELFTLWSRHPGCGFPFRAGLANTVARSRRLVPKRFERGFDWRLQRLAFACLRRMGAAGVSTIALPFGDVIRLDDAVDPVETLGRKRVVCSGWQITGWSLVERHAAALRSLFEPAPRYRDKATAFLRRLRGDHDMVVGLLVRQGDYREWRGGRYFFPTASYVRWIAELTALFPGRRVGVVVAGDERLDERAFAQPGVELASGSVNRGGCWFESFVELASCDLIVSPPSTFSACAAFLGDRPIMPLRTPDQHLDSGCILADHLIGAARDRDFTNAVQ